MKDLRQLICEKSGWPPGKYEERVFRECLHPHARKLAPLARQLFSGYFDKDMALIRDSSRATNLREFRAEIEAYALNGSHRGFLRGPLRVRISAKRLLSLAAKVLPP